MKWFYFLALKCQNEASPHPPRAEKSPLSGYTRHILSEVRYTTSKVVGNAVGTLLSFLIPFHGEVERCYSHGDGYTYIVGIDRWQGISLLWISRMGCAGRKKEENKRRNDATLQRCNKLLSLHLKIN